MLSKGLLAAAVLLGAFGCKHSSPEITAVPLSPWNQHEPAGIPFYLPKPLLIVAKNFRYVEEAKVGLTASAPIPNFYDDQAKYADVNARANFQGLPGAAAGDRDPVAGGSDVVAVGPAGAASVSEPVLHSQGAPISPGEAPSDGLTPDTFYTYQIVFVPDLSQKYGLRIKGGVGEIRAAMNLVNGWQFTGLGPYYMKDSSTAQNALSNGIAANLAASGVADVVTSISDLAEQLGGRGLVPGPDGRTVTTAEVREVFQQIAGLEPYQRLEGFAEIHVFEPQLNPIDGTVCWVPVTELSFYRDFIGVKTTESTAHSTQDPPEAPRGVPALPLPPPESAARAIGTRDGVLPAGSLIVNQNCAPGACPPPADPEPDDHHSLLDPFGIFHHHHARKRPTVRTYIQEYPLGATPPGVAADPGALPFAPATGPAIPGPADSLIPSSPPPGL
jgi:hypothetical protein